jgi:hypothetical protein
MRFEHCYRIDEDPRVPVAQKQQCWENWNQYFTRGQDRTRVEYARARVTTLRIAPTLGEPPAPVTECPTPASPYVPPPPTVAGDRGGNALVDRNDGYRRCGDDCARGWRMCGAACTNGADCNVGCDERYRGCMRGCL